MKNLFLFCLLLAFGKSYAQSEWQQFKPVNMNNTEAFQAASESGRLKVSVFTGDHMAFSSGVSEAEMREGLESYKKDFTSLLEREAKSIRAGESLVILIHKDYNQSTHVSGTAIEGVKFDRLAFAQEYFADKENVSVVGIEISDAQGEIGRKLAMQLDIAATSIEKVRTSLVIMEAGVNSAKLMVQYGAVVDAFEMAADSELVIRQNRAEGSVQYQGKQGFPLLAKAGRLGIPAELKVTVIGSSVFSGEGEQRTIGDYVEKDHATYLKDKELSKIDVEGENSYLSQRESRMKRIDVLVGRKVKQLREELKKKKYSRMKTGELAAILNKSELNLMDKSGETLRLVADFILNGERGNVAKAKRAKDRLVRKILVEQGDVVGLDLLDQLIKKYRMNELILQETQFAIGELRREKAAIRLELDIFNSFGTQEEVVRAEARSIALEQRIKIGAQEFIPDQQAEQLARVFEYKKVAGEANKQFVIKDGVGIEVVREAARVARAERMRIKRSRGR